MENQQNKDLETNKLIAQQICQSKEQIDEFYKNMGIQNPFCFNVFSSLSQPLLPLFRQQPINNTNNLFNPLPINIPKFEPLNFNPISNFGIGNLNKQTNWKVSNLNFGLEDNSINLSIKLENSTTINEIDKQKIKSALDSIKFIEKLIVDNGSVEKDENKNVEKQQNETKNNPSNDSNNQQNLRKIDKNLENQQRRQKIDKAYEQLRQMLIKSDEINQTQTNQIKELKTRLEQRKDQTILPKLVHAKNVEQNELRIKQLETKTKESSKNKSEQAIEKQIEQIQSEHKREIEDLKKEFQEEMKKRNF